MSPGNPQALHDMSPSFSSPHSATLHSHSVFHCNFHAPIPRTQCLSLSCTQKFCTCPDRRRVQKNLHKIPLSFSPEPERPVPIDPFTTICTFVLRRVFPRLSVLLFFLFWHRRHWFPSFSLALCFLPIALLTSILIFARYVVCFTSSLPC